VLARYSGEFTVFRELLQNSDDARSEEVEIVFETKPVDPEARIISQATGGPLPDLKTVLVSNYLVIHFRDLPDQALKRYTDGSSGITVSSLETRIGVG
jgi:hypothetical protein